MITLEISRQNKSIIDTN